MEPCRTEKEVRKKHLGLSSRFPLSRPVWLGGYHHLGATSAARDTLECLLGLFGGIASGNRPCWPKGG